MSWLYKMMGFDPIFSCREKRERLGFRKWKNFKWTNRIIKSDPGILHLLLILLSFLSLGLDVVGSRLLRRSIAMIPPSFYIISLL